MDTGIDQAFETIKFIHATAWNREPDYGTFSNVIRFTIWHSGCYRMHLSISQEKNHGTQAKATGAGISRIQRDIQ